MSGFSIRLARREDAAAFHRVEEDAATLLQEHPSLSGIALPPSATAEHYRALIGQGHCLAATVSDEVIGFAAARRVGRELHLDEMSVMRAHQRQRIGATLLQAVAIDARNCGLSAITLTTYRDIAWNEPFYARHGFVEMLNLENHSYLAEALADTPAGGEAGERVAMIKFLR